MADEMSMWSKPLDRLAEVASVRRVFGEPVTMHDRTVIPMARVKTAFGFGGGSGPAPAAGDAADRARSSGGGGGGGNGSAEPVGAIELNGDGVHIHTSPNLIARVVVVVALVVAWNVFWVTYTARRLRGRAEAGRDGGA